MTLSFFISFLNFKFTYFDVIFHFFFKLYFSLLFFTPPHFTLLYSTLFNLTQLHIIFLNFILNNLLFLHLVTLRNKGRGSGCRTSRRTPQFQQQPSSERRLRALESVTRCVTDYTLLYCTSRMYMILSYLSFPIPSSRLPFSPLLLTHLHHNCYSHSSLTTHTGPFAPIKTQDADIVIDVLDMRINRYARTLTLYCPFIPSLFFFFDFENLFVF